MLAIGTGGGAANRTHPENDWLAQGWSTTTYPAADAKNFGPNNPGGNLLSIGTTPQFAGPTGRRFDRHREQRCQDDTLEWPSHAADATDLG